MHSVLDCFSLYGPSMSGGSSSWSTWLDLESPGDQTLAGPARVFPESFTWESGTYPECEWLYPVGWIRRLNFKEEKGGWASAAIFLCFQAMRVTLTHLPGGSALCSSVVLSLTLRLRAGTYPPFLKLTFHQAFSHSSKKNSYELLVHWTPSTQLVFTE